MRRNAMLISVLLPMMLAGTGCNSSGKKTLGADAGFDPVDTYLPPTRETNFTADTYPTFASTLPVERSIDSSAQLSAPTGAATFQSPRYHTVVKRETLYALARTYYGDQRRWKDIYEANRATLRNPNRIRVGQKLIIP